MMASSRSDVLTQSPARRSCLIPWRFALTTAGASLLLAITVGCNTAAERADAHLDSSAASTVRPNSLVASVDSQQVALSVKGMYCKSCESTIAAMLRRTPGVLTADVSVARSEAVVLYNSSRTSPTKLIDVIGTLGYNASLKGS